jgi:predicted phosphodiesterase
MVAIRLEYRIVRVAVISDIHGNLHALEAVLAALDRERPDLVWCLGDLVGYGPHPNRCSSEVAARADLCLAGNHDLGVLGSLSLDDFSYDAAASARWTREVLTEEVRAYLAGLESTATPSELDAELFHASPRDPVWDYVLSAEDAIDALALTSAPLVLVGHSHVPLALVLEDGRLGGGVASEGAEADLSRGRWLLNPGSVGQPRDGDPRAAYLMIEAEARRAAFRRVPYPVERTQQEIRERGLPEPLAARLAFGA